MEWQRIGLRPPKAVTHATQSYLDAQDVLGEWLDERCERGGKYWESATALFDSWERWAEERSEWVGSVKSLSQRLEDRGGFVKCKNKEKTARGFGGLRLKKKEKADFFRNHGKPPKASKQPSIRLPGFRGVRSKPRGVRF